MKENKDHQTGMKVVMWFLCLLSAFFITINANLLAVSIAFMALGLWFNIKKREMT